MGWFETFIWLSVFALSLNADRCNGPPRYRCKNLQLAKDCNSQDECMKYWKNSKWTRYENDLSAKCVYCLHFEKFMVKDAHKLCTIDHSDNDCMGFLNSWKLNNSNKDNNVAFCNAIAMCNSHTYLGDINFGSSVCEDCEKIFEDIRALLDDNATADALIAKLNSLLCDHAPTAVREYCQNVVKSHVKSLLEAVRSEIKPREICGLIGICPLSPSANITLGDFVRDEKQPEFDHVTHTKCEHDPLIPWYYKKNTRVHPSFNEAQFGEKPSCDQCKAVFNQVRQVLKDPTMREKMKQDIDDKICSTLPSFLKTACASAINEHLDEILNGLDKADIGEVCAVFDMCPSAYMLQTRVQPGIPLPGTCQICEVIFHKLMTLLLGNYTEASIANALENVCKLVPLVYKPKCNTFVEQYGAKIIEAIIEGTAPKIMCTTLGLCGAFPIHQIPNPAPQLPKIEPCGTCKLLVTVIQQQLELNQTKEGLEKAVKQLCDFLPGSYGQECKSLVDMYLPTVIDYVSKSMTPAEICQEIGLCHLPNQMPLNQDGDIRPLCDSEDLDVLCVSLEVARKCDLLDACLIYRQTRYLSDSVQSSGCSICAELVSRWKLFKRLYGQVLENGHSCGNYVNLADRAMCQLVVNNRFKLQHKLMDSTLTTVGLCQQSGLCVAGSQKPSKTTAMDKSTQALVMICSMDYKKLCASKRTAALCGKVHFCRAFGPTTNDNNSERSKPLDIFGENACNWGPSYYCQSEEVAQRCGPEALKHCREKIWTSTEAPVVEHRVPDLGRNPCTWGPAFWCSSDENAKSCGPHAIEHCRRMSVNRA